MAFLFKNYLPLLSCFLLLMAFTIAARADNGNETQRSIARAKGIIKEYVSEKYAWNDGDYSISGEAEEEDRIIKFLVYHQDDKHPDAPGSGKSFLIEFDMQRMMVLKEIRFQ